MAAGPRRKLGHGGIDGQLVLVTGAAGDLGRAICLELTALGATVVASDRRRPDGWASGEESLSFIVCDVTDRRQVDELVGHMLERYGRIDGLVAAAGIVHRQGVLEVDPATWDEVLAVNLTGAFHVAQAAAQVMVPAGRGRIVLIGSWIGRYLSRGLVSYCVSKAGLDMLCRCFAAELAEHGVRVNLVAPGVIDAGVRPRYSVRYPRDGRKWRAWCRLDDWASPLMSPRVSPSCCPMRRGT